MQVHGFRDKLREGQDGEALLNDFFSQYYTVIPTPDMALQRSGIDAIWIKGGRSRLIEYKTDAKAGKTGNCFIELISNDSTCKAGWAYTSKADWLVYYVPGMGKVWIFSMGKLRDNLQNWNGKYKKREAINPTYRSVGILVPLNIVVGCCKVKEFSL